MDIDDTLIEWGGAVKALAADGDRVKVGGYIVLFGGPGDLSPKRDVFTKATDFALDVANRGRIRWHHGLDPAIGRRTFGVAEAKADPDDIGVWAEGWIDAADAYGKTIAGWIADGKVGWSTSAAPHMVARKAIGDGRHEITEWPMGGADWTLTKTPADPRQLGNVVALKSLIDAPVAGGSLVERSDRLVADATEILGLYAKAHDQRRAEGRTLSEDKRAALARCRDAFDAALKAARPRVDAARLRSLRLAALRLGASDL